MTKRTRTTNKEDRNQKAVVNELFLITYLFVDSFARNSKLLASRSRSS